MAAETEQKIGVVWFMLLWENKGIAFNIVWK